MVMFQVAAYEGGLEKQVCWYLTSKTQLRAKQGGACGVWEELCVMISVSTDT